MLSANSVKYWIRWLLVDVFISIRGLFGNVGLDHWIVAGCRDFEKPPLIPARRPLGAIRPGPTLYENQGLKGLHTTIPAKTAVRSKAHHTFQFCSQNNTNGI